MTEESKTGAGAGTWWVTAPNAVAPPRKSNSASLKGADPAPLTVFGAFKNTLAFHNSKPALLWKDSLGQAEWSQFTWAEYYNECINFAKSLLSIGFKPFHSVNIIGFNHPRWVIADMGCIAAGGMPAGIYTTNKPEAAKYISAHSEAEVIVVEDSKQLKKYMGIISGLPAVKAVVMYRNPPSGADKSAWAAIGTPAKLYSWEEFMGLGKTVEASAVEARIDAQKPGNCCTLIYTSGTTGPPKAVMISHDNATWTAGVIRTIFNVNPADRILSYLPLSHIAAQLNDVYGPMVSGGKVYFATPGALKGELKDWLNQIQPTIFFGVPRVWEKIKEAILAKSRENPAKGAKLKIVTKAKAAGAKRNLNIQFGGSGGSPCCYGLYNKLVFSKVKAALGLQHARICATGAAPIAADTLQFFANLGCPIYEVFGQSECTGPQTVNYPSTNGKAGNYKMCTAGPAIPGSFMAVVTPEGVRKERDAEGEVVYSGRHIMMGYMKNPAKTRETIDGEGWLHSGDKGFIDADGYLKITGRLKELLITEGGENVPPVLIEQTWKEICPAISNAMVIGDRRKYLTILLTLKVDVDLDTLQPTNRLMGDALACAAEIGSAAKTVQEAAKDPKWRKKIDEVMAAANERATSRAQTIKKWRLLSTDFSVPGGELTDTMKLKRSVAYAKYAEVIESMYDAKGVGK